MFCKEREGKTFLVDEKKALNHVVTIPSPPGFCSALFSIVSDVICSAIPERHQGWKVGPKQPIKSLFFLLSVLCHSPEISELLSTVLTFHPTLPVPLPSLLLPAFLPPMILQQIYSKIKDFCFTWHPAGAPVANLVFVLACSK